MWQDYVLGAVQWLFALALLPTLFHREHKPAFLTALLNVILMLIVLFVYVTLRFWPSATGAASITTAWGILTYQRYRINRRLCIPLFSFPRPPHWVVAWYNYLRGTS